MADTMADPRYETRGEYSAEGREDPRHGRGRAAPEPAEHYEEPRPRPEPEERSRGWRFGSRNGSNGSSGSNRRDDRNGSRAPTTPGEILRAARLRRRISLTEAEQATRIRQRYLQALEDDDYSVLPAGVYSVGFLRNYAIFLGVPPDDVVSTAEPRRRRGERRPGLQSVAPPIQLSAPRTTWLLVAGGVVALLLLALAWLGLSDPNNQAQQAAQGTVTGGQPAASSPAPAGGATATPAAVVSLPPLAPASTPTMAPTPVVTVRPATVTPTTNPSRVEVELRTVDRAWVRATVDGTVDLEETLPAGQTRRWSAQRSVALRVGNGAGVEVTVNGQLIGALGPANQPVDREFTR